MNYNNYRTRKQPLFDISIKPSAIQSQQVVCDGQLVDNFRLFSNGYLNAIDSKKDLRQPIENDKQNQTHLLSLKKQREQNTNKTQIQQRKKIHQNWGQMNANNGGNRKYLKNNEQIQDGLYHNGSNQQKKEQTMQGNERKKKQPGNQCRDTTESKIGRIKKNKGNKKDEIIGGIQSHYQAVREKIYHRIANSHPTGKTTPNTENTPPKQQFTQNKKQPQDKPLRSQASLQMNIANHQNNQISFIKRDYHQFRSEIKVPQFVDSDMERLSLINQKLNAVLGLQKLNSGSEPHTSLHQHFKTHSVLQEVDYSSIFNTENNHYRSNSVLDAVPALQQAPKVNNDMGFTRESFIEIEQFLWIVYNQMVKEKNSCEIPDEFKYVFGNIFTEIFIKGVKYSRQRFMEECRAIVAHLDPSLVAMLTMVAKNIEDSVVQFNNRENDYQKMFRKPKEKQSEQKKQYCPKRIKQNTKQRESSFKKKLQQKGQIIWDEERI